MKRRRAAAQDPRQPHPQRDNAGQGDDEAWGLELVRERAIERGLRQIEGGEWGPKVLLIGFGVRGGRGEQHHQGPWETSTGHFVQGVEEIAFCLPDASLAQYNLQWMLNCKHFG